jgi:hypothetical protein
VRKAIKLILILALFSLLISGCTKQSTTPSTQDTTPPQVTITSPKNGQVVSGSVKIQVSVTDNVGVKKVEFYIDGSKVGEDAVSPYEYIWDTDTLQYNSTHIIQVKAYDNAGNVGISNQVQVIIGDTQIPEVIITNPTNGSVVNGIITIQVSVFDKISPAKKTVQKVPSGIQKVEFYIDGNKVADDLTPPYEYIWNTNLYPNGDHTIQAKAFDFAGNIGESNIVQVKIQNTPDTTPPQVTILFPENGQTLFGTVTIQANASDNIGVTKVEFYIDGNKVGEDTTSLYEYVWNTDVLPYNSTHTIQAKAYDKAGNIGESDIVQVTIGDIQAPQVTITNPQNGAVVIGTIAIQANVIERISPAKKTVQKAPSGIQKVEFYIDGIKVGEDLISPYEYSWDTKKYSNATHYLQAKAYDKAGNVGISNVIQVTVSNTDDTIPPQVSITNLVYGQVVSGVIVIQASATDNIGVRKVEFYIDGEKVGDDLESPYEYVWNTDVLQYNSTHTIQAKAYDYADNIGVSTKIKVTIGDTQAPQVSIANLKHGDTVSGIVTIEANVVDKVSPAKKIIQKAPSGIQKVEFYIDDILVKIDTEYPYTYDWDTTQYANKNHKITVIAYDNLNHTGSTSIEVEVSGGIEVWQKTYGGSEWDGASSIQQTNDGGYIVAGVTNSFGAGGSDVYIIKLDADGNKVWEKIYGGSSSDGAYSIQQTNDGGYIVAGYTYSFGAGGSDVYIIKLDADGNKVWEKIYGGSSEDRAYSIQQTTDGRYIVAGYTNSFGAGGYDVYIIKLGENGNKVWEKIFGGSKWDEAYSIQQTNDGGYIVAGYTNSFGAGGSDVYVIKLDENGNKVWEKTYGGSSDVIMLNSIQQTSDGGYIVAGLINSFGARGYDVYVIRMDICGNTGPYPPIQGVSGALKNMDKPFGSPFDKMFPHEFLKK